MSKETHDHGLGHEKKSTNIIINARPRKFDGDEISYRELVNLAFPQEKDMTIVYSITYVGPQMSDGTLVEGQTVEIRNGVKFDVIKTNRS